MPIFRTLFVLLAIFIVFKVGQVLYRSHQRRNKVAAQAHNQQLSATVVPCAVCGTHVPQTEALSHNGRYVCSESHKKKLSETS